MDTITDLQKLVSTNMLERTLAWGQLSKTPGVLAGLCGVAYQGTT